VCFINNDCQAPHQARHCGRCRRVYMVQFSQRALTNQFHTRQGPGGVADACTPNAHGSPWSRRQTQSEACALQPWAPLGRRAGEEGLQDGGDGACMQCTAGGPSLTREKCQVSLRRGMGEGSHRVPKRIKAQIRKSALCGGFLGQNTAAPDFREWHQSRCARRPRMQGASSSASMP
jgi:hypothetical protein